MELLSSFGSMHLDLYCFPPIFLLWLSFFENLDRLAAKDYQPTEQDILRTKRTYENFDSVNVSLKSLDVMWVSRIESEWKFAADIYCFIFHQIVQMQTSLWWGAAKPRGLL